MNFTTQPLKPRHPATRKNAAPCDSHDPFFVRLSQAEASATLPVAEIVKIKHWRGTWSLTVTCPYCNRPHAHGGGQGEQPYFGTRVSHCETGGGSYCLIAVGGANG